MEIINSQQNKFVKEINNIVKKNEEFFIIEGKKFVIDIKRKEDIEFYAVSETFFYENTDFCSFVETNKIKVFSDNVFKKFSDTKNSQGILCVVKKYNIDIQEAFLEAGNFILILDGLQDPGNFGTIIRTFRATGGKLVLTTKNAVSVYNQKCIRSTAGVIEKVDIIEKLDNNIIYENIKKHGFQIVGTHLKGKKSIYEIDLTKKIALVVGNEGQGMSEFFTQKADILTKIPMNSDVESLNASVATSVVLYEALRQNL